MPSEDPTKRKSLKEQIAELEPIFSENLSTLEHENISVADIKQVIEKLIELFERKRVIYLGWGMGMMGDIVTCATKMNELKDILKDLREESFTDEDRRSVVTEVSHVILGGPMVMSETQARSLADKLRGKQK